MRPRLILCLLFLAACAGPTPSSLYPTVSRVPPPATLTSTPPPAPIACPAPGNPSPIQATSNLTTTRTAILDYLNSEFTTLARVFEAQITAGHTPEEACLAVTTLVQANYPDVSTNLIAWNENNLSHTNDTLCPFH